MTYLLYVNLAVGLLALNAGLLVVCCTLLVIGLIRK